MNNFHALAADALTQTKIPKILIASVAASMELMAPGSEMILEIETADFKIVLRAYRTSQRRWFKIPSVFINY